MRPHFLIVFVILWFISACSPCPREKERMAAAMEQAESVYGDGLVMLTMVLPPQLADIDTLMQSRPDSALTLLLDAPDDTPYYQLLLSEALYKNDYQQANRQELLEAMAYYDSVGDPFLSARCHYMNGVGYYEMDSVVPACEEYMKALEVMKEHFDEKDLVGYKAKFMALTHIHLCQLFSDQYFHEQAVHFGKSALCFFNKYDAERVHIAWIMNNIGMHYQAMEQLDSARYYFEKALELIPDTNNIAYRDAATALALLSYHQGDNPQFVYEQLNALLNQSENQDEYLSHCLIIGTVFYYEQQFDSAWIYLKKVFDESTKSSHKKQAAEWLVEICKCQGINSESYIDFLIPFVNQVENNSGTRAQLTKQYDEHIQREQTVLSINKRKNVIRNGLVVVGIMMLLGGCLVVFLFENKRKRKLLQSQIEATEIILEKERQSHRIQQAALGGRLKQKNKALKEQKQSQEIKPSAESKQDETNKDIRDFLDESICRHIISVCHDIHNPIKSTVSISAYSNIALDDKQKAQLKDAANRHYGKLFENIKKRYPSLKEKDYLYCYLCLLGLNNVQIAALLQKSASTIWEREHRLHSIFSDECDIGVILYRLMNN